MVDDELRIRAIGFGILSTGICLLIGSEKVVGLHHRAQMGFDNGLEQVHAWCIENWVDYRVECGVLT